MQKGDQSHDAKGEPTLDLLRIMIADLCRSLGLRIVFRLFILRQLLDSFMAANLADNKMSAEDIQESNDDSRYIYRVLSRGFSLEIDEAYLEWLVLLEPTIKQLAAHIDNKDFKKGSEALDNFVKNVKLNYEKDKSAFLLHLAAEYASLFLNVGPRPVYLVESVYLGREPLLYEEPVLRRSQNLPTLRFQEKAIIQGA